jgi:archaetidylinositol phosphate synthase
MQPEVSPDGISGSFRAKTTLLRPVGEYIRLALVPRVPAAVQPWQLTVLTLPLIGIVVLCGWRAGSDPRWLWAVSVLVAVQYVADVLDGELGRVREAGLVRWGFYMDHLADALFISAVIGVYVPVYPDSSLVLIGVIAIANGLFLHEALACVCTGSYNSYGHHGMGLEEGRALVVIVNSIVALSRPDWIHWVFVAVLALLGTILVEQLFVTQRGLWARDLAERAAVRAPPPDAAGRSRGRGE